MKSEQFKLKLKSIKETLRGKTVKVSLHGVSTRYNSLRDLGNRILELDNKNYTFSFYKGDYTDIVVNSNVNMSKAVKEFGTAA